MNLAPAVKPEATAAAGLSDAEAARERMLAGWGDPLFVADWDRAVFLHFEVDAAELQAVVPFELDLFDGGRAMISLVAFTMSGMRPVMGGALAKWLTAPLASHEFLNLRTYVRRGDEAGIFFMREWMPNPLGRCLGPLSFGLPYRLGTLDYRHCRERDEMCGEVRAQGGRGRLAYRATRRGAAAEDTVLRDFLLERYTAFTSFCGLRRKFRVWHDAWRAVPVAVEIEDDSILDLVPGCATARLACAHYSAGVRDVWMGRPRLA